MSLHGRSVACIIPMLNEEASIGKVLAALPPSIDTVICVNNGSTDRSADVARSHGAVVVDEPERGYGAACLRGLMHTTSHDVICFIDGDYSDHPEDLVLVLEPVCAGNADLCIGSRVTGSREAGALLPQAMFGNWLSTRLIRLFWHVSFTDLGPMRAITREACDALQMRDRTYGWTVEMQIKAAAQHYRCTEVPVRYRKRIGTSKVTGTVKGSVKAGVKILWTIGAYALRGHR